MARLFYLVAVILIIESLTSDVSAIRQKCWTIRRQFGCVGAKDLTDLDGLSKLLVKIIYQSSSIPHVHGNAFARFKSLRTLDLHEDEILSIDTQAFTGLRSLRNLTLRRNKLTWVDDAWFNDLVGLQFLDLSFNEINYISEQAFTKFPVLQTLNLESNKLSQLNWNVFGYAIGLQSIKLGNNPWNWLYRAMIGRQLEDQRVEYASGWENFDWINHIIWHCMDNGAYAAGEGPLINCVVMSLVEEHKELFEQSAEISECRPQMKTLLNCSKPDPPNNITLPEADAKTRLLQSFIGSLEPMKNPNTKWEYRTITK